MAGCWTRTARCRILLDDKVRRKFERLAGVLDERGRRVWAAAEAESLGY